MARKCKCQVTGEIGTTDSFFKVTKDGKNKYYKSQEVYEKHIEKIESRKKLLRFIGIEILDYKTKQPLPTVLLRKISELNSFYTYEVILETFIKCKDNLKYWMNLEDKFDTEYQRICYMMAIINNNVVDVYKEWERKQCQAKNDVSIDIEVLNESNNKTIKKKENKGISDFL